MQSRSGGSVLNADNAVKGNNIKILKEANKFLILQCIMKYAPISTEDVVRRTSLSRPTVLNLVKELMEEGIVVKDGYSESCGGRAAALLNLSGERHFAVGIDFEFPIIRMAIANMKGDIRAAKTLNYDIDIEKDALMEDLLRELDQFIADSGVEKALIDGVGIGLPGVIDTVNGISMNIERIHGWQRVDIQKKLERHLKLAVYIQNDVHLMGLVEKRLYLGDETTDFIYIGLRAGIGSIIYQNNHPMAGEKGNAGFIGHTTLDPKGPPCRCGSWGCLDVYAGKLSIVERYREKSGLQGADGELPDFDRLVKMAGEGDSAARAVLSEAGSYLGIAISNIVKTMEISKVVIGGSPALESSVFFKTAEDALQTYLTDNLGVKVSVYCGQLPEDKYALGGCFMVFDNLFSKPKLSLSMV